MIGHFVLVSGGVVLVTLLLITLLYILFVEKKTSLSPLEWKAQEEEVPLHEQQKEARVPLPKAACTGIDEGSTSILGARARHAQQLKEFQARRAILVEAEQQERTQK